MRKSVLCGVILVGILTLAPSTILGQENKTPPSESKASELKLETLLEAVLEGVEGTEVIVSRVTMPPNSSLPKHWHPGEEFAYILEGSVTVWQEGQEDVVGHAGDVLKVPLKHVHSAFTKDEGATILVFRVHEQGQPERVPVEGD